MKPVSSDAEAQACAMLRRRTFLASYGPMGLADWPGAPDEYDTGPNFLAAWQGDTLVGTVLSRHDIYDAARPFWHERFGVPVDELVPGAAGRRIAELGRLAVDQDLTDRPLEVVTALGRATMLRLEPIGGAPVVAAAMSAPMLAFYRDVARRVGATLRVHPRKGSSGGFPMTMLVLTLPDQPE